MLTRRAFVACSPALVGQTVPLATPDVPFVPSITPVVDEMLRIAKLQKDDVVYDLGCGDGRIVVAAAARYGVRGVGIDNDPERIREAREAARKARVADRATFLLQDLFAADIHRATVVMLYLLPGFLDRLRPKLQRELRPGARIISHNFGFSDWPPDQETSAADHVIYLWRIAAPRP